MKEEIGGEVIKTEYLGRVTPDSGVQGTVVSVYACELSSFDYNSKTEGICEILEVTPTELRKWISEEKITDGFTLAALCLFEAKCR